MCWTNYNNKTKHKSKIKVLIACSKIVRKTVNIRGLIDSWTRIHVSIHQRKWFLKQFAEKTIKELTFSNWKRHTDQKCREQNIHFSPFLRSRKKTGRNNRKINSGLKEARDITWLRHLTKWNSILKWKKNLNQFYFWSCLYTCMSYSQQ